MCNSNNSSKIASLSKKENLKKFFGINQIYDSTSMVDYLRNSLDNIVKITISGGEPMLDKNLKSLVDELSKSHSLKMLTLSTNMTILDYELIEKLSKLKSIKKTLSISLDGPKNIHEYIRHNCVYEDIVNNLKYLSDNYKDNFVFNINSTISVYNIGYIKETLESFVELLKKTNIRINFLMSSPVLNPDYLHPGILPDYLKSLYIEKINSLNRLKYQLYIRGSNEFIQTSINLLKENHQDRFSKFLEFNQEFDKVTQNNFRKLYPEFF
jgi:sulfatase maturation enzyme AslB (radical SAM superfamily)